MAEDLTGLKFGMLTVVNKSVDGTIRHPKYNCLCSCGNKHIANRCWLKKSKIPSCGCIRRTQNSLSGTKSYFTWRKMLGRCNNFKNKRYCYYGARGIKVCDSWLKFLNFYADMGERPAGKTLDRIDNNGNYTKENCRWASHQEQCRNRRSSRFLEAFGEKLTLIEWANKTGIDSNMILRRLAKKLSVEEALSLKPNRRVFKQLTAFGKTQKVSAWSKEKGIHDSVIRGRLNSGWSAEDALTLKPSPKNKNYKTLKALSIL